MDKKEKDTSLRGAIIDSLIIISVLGAFVYSYFDASGPLIAKGLYSLRFYTVLSNLLLSIFSIPHLVYEIIGVKEKKNIPHFATILKFIGTVGTTLTFLVVVFFLSPSAALSGGSYFSMFKGSNLIYHLIAPLLGIASFCLYSRNEHLSLIETLYGLSSVALYGAFYISNLYARWLSGGEGVYDWYGFLGPKGEWPLYLVAPILLLAAYLICLGLYYLRRLSISLLSKKKNVDDQ